MPFHFENFGCAWPPPARFGVFFADIRSTLHNIDAIFAARACRPFQAALSRFVEYGSAAPALLRCAPPMTFTIAAKFLPLSSARYYTYHRTPTMPVSLASLHARF